MRTIILPNLNIAYTSNPHANTCLGHDYTNMIVGKNVDSKADYGGFGASEEWRRIEIYKRDQGGGLKAGEIELVKFY